MRAAIIFGSGCTTVTHSWYIWFSIQIIQVFIVFNTIAIIICCFVSDNILITPWKFTRQVK